MRTTWKPLALAAAMAVLAPPVSAALVTSHIPDDATLTAYLTNIAFVAEGRIGDGAGAATFELDLGPDTAVPAVTKQYGWLSGQVEPFTLSYDAGLNQATFVLGGQTLQFTPVPGFTVVAVRTRAVNAASSILVGDLVLDGEALGDVSFADGDAGGLDILDIEGASLNDGFALTGTAVLTWAGAAPTQSRLAFQIKVGTPDSGTPVEQASWGRIKRLYR